MPQERLPGRAENEIMRSGGYSWVGDIRVRVALAKTTARDEAEFLGILDALGVHVADNSAKVRRDDWVFSLADEPSKKVSCERLGFVYGKEMLRRRFAREGAYRPTDASIARIREAARDYMAMNGLMSLKTRYVDGVGLDEDGGNPRDERREDEQ